MLPYFEIFGQKIFTYPLLMGAAWGLAVQIAKRMDERNGRSFRHLGLYMAGAFLFSWLGAKAFYLWTADFAGKTLAMESAGFWLGGGFVFYGGMIFGLLFTLVFAVKTGQPMFKFNIFAPALALGHAVGRVGCFFAGCCYGALYDGPGSVHLHGAGRYPVQLLEAAALVAFAFYSMKSSSQQSRYLVPKYILFYAVARFVLEFIRGDRLRGIWFWGASTSQIVSLVVAFMVACALVYQRRFAKVLG